MVLNEPFAVRLTLWPSECIFLSKVQMVEGIGQASCSAHVAFFFVYIEFFVEIKELFKDGVVLITSFSSKFRTK